MKIIGMNSVNYAANKQSKGNNRQASGVEFSPKMQELSSNNVAFQSRHKHSEQKKRPNNTLANAIAALVMASSPMVAKSATISDGDSLAATVILPTTDTFQCTTKSYETVGDATFNPNKMFPEIVNDNKLYLRNSSKDASSGLLKFSLDPTIDLSDIRTMQVTAYTKDSASDIKANMANLYLQNLDWDQDDETLPFFPIACDGNRINKCDAVVEYVGHGVNKVTWDLDVSKFSKLYNSDNSVSFLMKSEGKNSVTYLPSEYSPKDCSDTPRLNITSVPEPDVAGLIGSAGMILLLTNRKRQIGQV